MVTAFLGLGANLGDRLGSLRGARQALDKLPGITVVKSSALYETVAVGGPPGQDAYLNAVLEITTTLSADKLLENCLAVEKQFGRERLIYHGPRTLDIDLLFFSHLVCEDRDLTLPHPRLHLRAFVLIPLRDLAPEMLHPLQGKTVRQLCDELPCNQGIKYFSRTW
ncbi:2-amino-4-hydroxy-6-hydroxymethyldihydropteridine diphosphokinase [Syntrophotalea acetylenivorans]|uniref:2-amino-4-hydroxy-6-hydroxymethyldihydropteridine pyrophosphokinase n=1 Tax=Syntrophotalea acetylenivorans TaxID=1842532 RepID=A0A1L3GQS1_9BACT|nr:2-amino-4-hydroxy-6-hydroxymethyldihydropteridine diphosphokinase [Syntrophotalea acetylenivorans]APG28301.1 2-amino-4-hydroxy-6-hydroxymethyldihydropteridine diphosphokinase [Syntrophotalea acetylenivorans]